jgi:hypothetical protein
MVRNAGFGISRTPIVIVGFPRLKDRHVTLIAITEASTAGTLAATVIVRDDVVFPVTGIVTRANPGDR